jgi:hypothetical protein
MTGKNKKSAVRGERTGRRKGGWMSVVNQVFIPVQWLIYKQLVCHFFNYLFLFNYFGGRKCGGLWLAVNFQICAASDTAKSPFCLKGPVLASW